MNTGASIEQRALTPLLVAGIASEYKINIFLNSEESPQQVAGSFKNERGFCGKKGTAFPYDIGFYHVFFRWGRRPHRFGD
jgi:hypothetical protein